MKRYKRSKPNKCPSPLYLQFWRIVDGAVADAFNHHPEYLTPSGKARARQSIVKRVTGALNGYAAEVAKARSGGEQSRSGG